jgi:gliding motility-associated protein GldM
MSGVKLTPRQKMINMMYLVLTAILALNVSAEVLNAFKTVNDGISASNNSLRDKNADTYAVLRKQYERDSLKARDAYVKAERAKELSTQLYSLLAQYKTQMIAEAGGLDAITGKIKRDDDIEIATRMFVENNGRNGKDLKLRIENTRAELLKLLSDADRAEGDKLLPLKTNDVDKGKTWEYAKFNQVPVVAAVTLLSKYQNDLLSAESHVIETLFGSIDRDKHKVDEMAAMVMSPSNFVLQGETYKADVMVAAYSSTQHPEVFLGQFNQSVKKDEHGNYPMISSISDALPLSNAQKVEVDGGDGKIIMAGNSIGNKKYTGVVRVKAPGEGYEFYPFEGEYQVAPKMAVVSPKMMNVMYIGLDNTIEVSVPGIASSDVSPVLDAHGSLVKNTDGSYTAKLTAPGSAKVIVKARVNGREMVMGEQQFRVKPVPSPVSTLDGVYEGGKISLTKIRTTRGIVPQVKNFEFAARFEILSYTVSYRSHKEDNISPPMAVTGPVYDDKIKDIIERRLQAGDDIFFDNVIVRGPAGDKRKINDMAFAVTK